MQIRYRGIANLLVEKTIVTQNRCKTLRFPYSRGCCYYYFFSIWKGRVFWMEHINLTVFHFQTFVKILSEILNINKQKQCLIQQNHIRIYQFFLRSIANLLDRSVGPKESKTLKFKTILYNHPFCLLRANAYHIVDWNSLCVV